MTDSELGDLVALFRRSVERFPDRVAVTDASGSVTYRQLSERVTALSGLLRERSAEESGAAESEHVPVVGLCAERSVELAVGVLAILDAGLGYLPLTPEHPVGRLTAIADRVSLGVVVCDSASREIARHLAPVVIDTLTPSTAPPTASSVLPAPSDLAYLMFTSGSTGTPKGVLVEHRNVVSLLRSCERVVDVNEHDVWSMAHSYAFDFSVWEMWGALACPPGDSAPVAATERVVSGDRIRLTPPATATSHSPVARARPA
ncbi:MAG: AMP-binding protein [Angustibacter sp.]